MATDIEHVVVSSDLECAASELLYHFRIYVSELLTDGQWYIANDRGLGVLEYVFGPLREVGRCRSCGAPQ